MKTVNNASPRHRSVSSALWLPLLTCAAMLAGCTTDDAPHAGDNRRTPVTFSTSIQTPLPQAGTDATPGTRTATDANGNAVWTQGDAVSISMLTAGGTLPGDILPDCANVRYNVDPITGALTPASGTPMYYPQSPQDAKVDFIAWHAATTSGEDYLLPLSTGDQATADKQLALDPLYSNNAKGISPGTAPVALQFRHLMSKVKFDLTLGVGLAGGTVTDVRLEGLIETASFDLRDGSVKNPLAPAEPIKALKSDAASDGADATYTALLIPQDANTNATPRTIVVTVNGKEYSGPIPNEDVFTANAMCIYPVTVRETGVEVGIPTTDVPWAEGELPTVTIDGKIFRLIRNDDDLKRFADDVNGGQRDLNAIQTADIDLKGIDNWVPINWGDRASAPFTGIYNGNGYTISNLTISSMTNGFYFGLFGVIGGSTLLTGIHLRDVEITGDVNRGVGALAGRVGEDATVTLCSAKGEINVRGKGDTGGLAGVNYGAITRCRTDVTVTTDATLIDQASAYAGGITGSNYNGGLLFACHATGSVTLTGRREDTPENNVLYAGGITGNNSGYVNSFANIYCCIAEGNVSATAETAGINVYAGGLVGGFHLNGDIKSNYARGTAVAKSEVETSAEVKAGAIVGRDWDSNGSIEYCYGTGAGGQGTSNLEASNNIAYSVSPAASDIYNVIKGGDQGVIQTRNIPFTTYNPAATPAYGISIVKKDVTAKDFWQGENATYPSLNFLNNN